METTTQLKTADNLSEYAIDPQGQVIELDTQDQVKEILNPSQSRNDFKLLTDETVWLESKQKSIRLWRRFTREELIKLYHRPTSKPVNLGAPVKQNVPDLKGQVNSNAQVGTSSAGQVENNGTSAQVSGQVKQGTSSDVLINGTSYKSINEAAQQLGLNRKVVKKRLDSPEFPNYNYC